MGLGEESGVHGDHHSGRHLRKDGSVSTRQILRQQRELEEKRKFGLAPLAVDTVTHQEISPNVPLSIAQAPWYYGATGPTLEHQRKRDANDLSTALADKRHTVSVTGQAASFVAGACKNCGSRTHKTRECIHAKKKVGAVYTGKVTGLDVDVKRSSMSYSQKRDRYVGDIGVDLLSAAVQEGEASKLPDDNPNGAPRLRREEVFSTRTAQHGGVEIKELPKYLQNLDQHDGLFFDPKTGSMRGNPNAEDPTKTFQGDLGRYRSGDYAHYVEAQYRFLTGKSKCFVDLEHDEQMRREKDHQMRPPVDGDGTAVSSVEDSHGKLVRSLYGNTSMPAPTVPKECTETKFETSMPSALNTIHSSSGWVAETMEALPLQATRSSHPCAFGSYFDVSTFRWGYHCCRKLDMNAPSCVR